MANEKRQGAQGADVDHAVSALRLMENGAFDEGGLLLENYCTSNEINDEVAPVFLAYALRCTSVAHFLEGQKYKVDLVDFSHASEKKDMLLEAIEALERERKTKLLHTYLPEVLSLAFVSQEVDAEVLYAFLLSFGEYAKSVLISCIRRGCVFYGKFAPLLVRENVVDFFTSVIDPFYTQDKALYGKETLALGKAALSGGNFEGAKALFDNASYHLSDLTECRFLMLCATLGAKNEFEFLRAENFSKSMPEYINLLVAASGNAHLTKKYTDLAEKNLSGEYYGTDYIPTRDGEYIYFGQYPQSLKLDGVKVASKPSENGFYKGSDGAFYVKVSATPWNCSQFMNGEAIKRGKTYYFKVEPIRWRILEENTEEKKVLLMCDWVLDRMNQHSRAVRSNYQNGDYRPWLQNAFYNDAFSNTERRAILETVVDNSATSTGCTTNANTCPNTNDRIFALSVAEMTNPKYGFDIYSATADKARQRVATDYVRAKGISYSNIIETLGVSSYWLRSPQRGYNDCDHMFYVSEWGKIDAIRGDYEKGVCPAMWVSLDKLPLEFTIQGPTEKTKGKTNKEAEKASGDARAKTPSADASETGKIKKFAPLVIFVAVALLVALLCPIVFKDACDAADGTYGAYKRYQDGWGLSGSVSDDQIVNGEFYIPEILAGENVVSLESFSLSSGALRTVYIPKTVVRIDAATFAGATNLTNIYVDEDNPAYTSIDGVLYSKDQSELIAYPAGKTQSEYSIPDGVCRIAYRAFDSAVHLRSVTIPESVTVVEANIFYKCSTLIVLCVAPEAGEDWNAGWEKGVKGTIEVIWDCNTPGDANT